MYKRQTLYIKIGVLERAAGRMRQFTAGKNEQDMRLSRFVQRVARKLPASAIDVYKRQDILSSAQV